VLQTVNVQAPVYSGVVIVRDVLGTGIDVIATRDMPRAS
jgi:CxxC motif-containing protein